MARNASVRESYSKYGTFNVDRGDTNVNNETSISFFKWGGPEKSR